MQESGASIIYHKPSRRLRLRLASSASFFLSIVLNPCAVDGAVLSPTRPETAPDLAIGRREPQEDDNSSKAAFPGYSGPNPKPSPYLPAQIGAIVGAYAISLVIVAVLLLLLSKVRRRRLQAADELDEDEEGDPKIQTFDDAVIQPHPEHSGQHPSFPYPLVIDTSAQFYPPEQPQSPRNFSYPASISPTRTEHSTYLPSPVSTILAPGVDLSVDQSVVATDRRMAQQQLEDMYKLVMEQEAAKEAGVALDPPTIPQSYAGPSNASNSTLTKKEKRGKPAHLELGGHEKKESRTSAFFSALKSPRKKKVQGISISSPIMTPMSATFPRGPEGQEMSTIPPRHYAPAAPPPIPNGSGAYVSHAPRHVAALPLTPEMSPRGQQSIDGRIGAQLTNAGSYQRQQEQMEAHLENQYQQQRTQRHQRGESSNELASAISEVEPVSAASEKSTTPLIGLPSSPKPNVTRFPADSLRSLPSSPKPGSSFSLPLSPRATTSFSRPNPPSAVRTGGALPLRAYEPALQSPNTIARTTRETTFERTGPLSPSGQRTPFTGAAVPYSPYQPFSPVIPMTPSLVTREDRKRMKRLEPKTPTLEMVKSSDDIW